MVELGKPHLAYGVAVTKANQLGTRDAAWRGGSVSGSSIGKGTAGRVRLEPRNVTANTCGVQYLFMLRELLSNLRQARCPHASSKY